MKKLINKNDSHPWRRSWPGPHYWTSIPRRRRIRSVRSKAGELIYGAGRTMGRRRYAGHGRAETNARSDNPLTELGGRWAAAVTRATNARSDDPGGVLRLNPHPAEAQGSVVPSHRQ